MWHLTHLRESWETGVNVGKTGSEEQGRKSKQVQWKMEGLVDGLANYLLVISGNFLLRFSNSVISTFSKGGHDEVWHTLETRVGKFFCKGPDNKYFKFCRLHSQM